jgi:GT2 family glycosyltransferase
MPASVIIYASNVEHLDRTIDDLLDKTPPSLLAEVVVALDAAVEYRRPGVKVNVTAGLGRAKAWNASARQAVGEVVVFLKSVTKVGVGWLEPLLAALTVEPKSLVSPVIHTLDPQTWSTESARWRRFGWRWDMQLYDRPQYGRSESPAISAYCIVANRDYFLSLGGFDEGMETGSGEDLELSIKAWFNGGKVKVIDEATVAAAYEVDDNPRSANNAIRIAETWFPQFVTRVYQALQLDKPLDPGRIKNQSTKSSEFYLFELQPELLSVFDLHLSASGKRVAVIAPGPSLDHLEPALIQRHDLIIGVDYTGLLYQCDFVVTDAVQVVKELAGSYSDDKFVLPLTVLDRTLGKRLAAAEVAPRSIQFELMRTNGIPSSQFPPFVNYDNLALTAVHFALFLGAKSVTLFGFDGKLIGEQSHTSKLEAYDDGKLWSDSESTRRRFASFEYGLDKLSKLAVSLKIPLFRVSHA